MVSGARGRSAGCAKAECLDRTGSGPQAPAVFICPMQGCSRQFAELWKLRAHYRSPMRTAQGQGGHASELPNCPRCNEDLVPGLPHLGCAGGLAAPRQAAKRKRQQMRRVEGGLVRRCMSLDVPQPGAAQQLPPRALSGVDQSTFSFLDEQLARFQADPSGPVGRSLLQATPAPAAAGGDTPPELRHLVSAFVQAIMNQQAEQGKDASWAAGGAPAAAARNAATALHHPDSSDSCSEQMGSPVVTRASCCGGGAAGCGADCCLAFGSPAPVNSASCAPHPGAPGAPPTPQQPHLPATGFEAFARAGSFAREGALKVEDTVQPPRAGMSLHSLKSENILTPREWPDVQLQAPAPLAVWPPSSQAASLSPAPASSNPMSMGMVQGPAPPMAGVRNDDDGRGAPLPPQAVWGCGRTMSPMPPLCFTPPLPPTLGGNALPAWWRPASAAGGPASLAGFGRQDSLAMLMAAAARGGTPQPRTAGPQAVPQHMWHSGCGGEAVAPRSMADTWIAEPEAWADGPPAAALSSVPQAQA